jgi:ferredoxin-type protein NapH
MVTLSEQIKKINLRKAIQNSFFVVMIFLTLFMITGKINSAHQFCPYSAVCFGAMAPRGIITYSTTIILSLIILVLTIFIGRKFCSYICFLGTLQEKLFNLFKRSSPIVIHPWLHKILSWFKYLILVFTLTRVILLVQYVYFEACPVLSISFITQITIKGIIILAIIFVLGIFFERFWCRYMCPYGALLNIFQALGKLLGLKRAKILRDISDSMECRNCPNYCPMGIDINTRDIIEDLSCIHCMKCIRTCSETDRSKENCIRNYN